jgi:hypothetical protein
MAVTPIELPDPFPCRSKVFQLRHLQQNTPVGSGFIQTIDRSTPGWYAEYETAPLGPAQYAAMISFLMKMEGSMNTFLAYDPRYEMPAAYASQPVTAHPWVQVGQAHPRITARDYANSTISLDRLLTGAIITAGDYISVLISNVWHLMRCTATHTVSGSTATISVKPRPVFTVSVATDIRYRRACCAMKMLQDYKETDIVDGFPVLRFEAAQFIDRT